MRARHLAHTATTAALAASYPFITEGGLGGAGCYIGLDVYGGSFAYDPWLLMKRGITTDLTVAIIGQKGRAKSSLAKCLSWRMLAFGVQSWIIDPKGEFGPLCEAAGATPIRLEPGGAVRLNPLDVRHADPSWSHEQLEAEQLVLLNAILQATLRRELTMEERSATEMALRAASDRSGGEPTLPLVVDALFDPTEEHAAELRTTPSQLAQDGRTAALGLRQMVSPTGALRGLFDGPTRGGIDLQAPVVCFDLSTLRNSPALGVLMTCASSWMQRALLRKDGVRRLMIWDEAWEMMADLACARWMQRSLKYGRVFDVANVLIVHRVSDFLAAGNAGTEQNEIARGLIQDSETRILYWQRREHLTAAQQLLSLSAAECEEISNLPKARALWQVAGTRSFLVDHLLAPDEWPLVRTDDSDLGEEEVA